MKRLLKVTAMAALLTLFRMSMGFLVAKMVAIYTGPSGLAMLGQLQSMINSFHGIVNSPVDSGIVRYTAENHQHGFNACSPWWRASLQWVLLISVFIIPLGLLFAHHVSDWLFHDSKLAWIVVVAVCLLPFTVIGTLFISVINGQQQYRRYMTIGIASTLLSSGFMLFMIELSSLQGALLAVTVQGGINGVIILLTSLRQPWLKLRYWWGITDNSARKAIGGYILMALTSALTVPVSLLLVRNILIEQVGWIAAGQWQAVWKISEAYLAVITIALGIYYLPKLSSLSNVNDIVSEIHKTAKLVIPIVVVLALGVYFFRDGIILLLFTKDFHSARDLFAVQLCGDVVKVISWLYAYPMLSRGAIKWFISTEIIFAVSFVCLVDFLTYKTGAQGANFAYLINYSLYMMIVYFNIKRFCL